MVKLISLSLATASLMLAWPSGAASQETMQRSWNDILDMLRKNEVAISMSGGDILSVSMTKTDTSEDHGLLNLQWDQRQEAIVELLEIEKNVYVVLGVNGTRSLKAPWGSWHVVEEGMPGFVSEDWRVEEEGTPGFNVMLSAGDRIQGAVRTNPQQRVTERTGR